MNHSGGREGAMGIFDFFKRDKTDDGGKPVDRKLASLAKTTADKRAQAYDRDEAMRALIKLGTPDAAAALLKRFSIKVDPSITDSEEKQLAFDGIVSIGRGGGGIRLADVGKDPKEIDDAPLTKEEVAELRDAVVECTREYCARAENLNWALKLMRALLDDDGYQAEVLALLGKHDTEYSRNVEPKINLLCALEDIVSDAVREAVEEYLQDVNETVRFHAVETTFKQGNDASVAPLVAMIEEEESVRVKNKVADGMVRLSWSIPDALRDAAREALTDAREYRVRDDGSIEKVA
jgi:HEAT repeat protein